MRHPTTRHRWARLLLAALALTLGPVATAARAQRPPVSSS